MHLLFALPVEIWQEHILQFTALVDIVRASSAFCNWKVQLQFRYLIDGLTLQASMSVSAGQAKQITWFLKRNILSRSLLVTGKLDEDILSILPRICAKATSLNCIEITQNFDPTSCLRLECLELWRCPVVSLGNLCVCPSLKILHLQDCLHLTTESLLHSLVGCNRLEDCVIKGCVSIHQLAISHILNHIPNLTSFHFGGGAGNFYDLSAIADACLLEAVAKSRIRQLVMTYYSTVCRAGVQKLVTLFPQLRKLHLDVISSTLTDGDVELLCMSLPYLADLALNGFDLITSASLESITRCVPFLQRLSVAYCRAIDDEGVIAVAKSCAQLTALNISHCDKVTNTAVREVWLRCLLLQDLYRCWCVRVSDAAFAERVNSSLQTLDFSYTSVTGAFFRQTPNLVYLYCDRCPLLGSDFVNGFIHHPASFLAYVCLSQTTLSASDLLVLSTHLPKIQTLRLPYSNVDDTVIRSIAAHCLRLKNLVVHACAAVTQATVNELNRLYKHRLRIDY